MYLIFEFCVVTVQSDCTPRAWLPDDLATSPLVCNLYIQARAYTDHVAGARDMNVALLASLPLPRYIAINHSIAD